MIDIYKTVIETSTPDELALLLEEMTAEFQKYRRAFWAAKTFIDSHVADPDITQEMREKYDLYLSALREANI